jgi:hypothetical protein
VPENTPLLWAQTVCESNAKSGGQTCTRSKEAGEWVIRGMTGYKWQDDNWSRLKRALVFDLFRNIFILWVHIYGLCIRVSRLILSVGPRGLPNNSLSAPEYAT